MNRPRKKNSLTIEGMQEIAAAVKEARSSGSRAILIRGSGGSFCAGRDLSDVDPKNDDTLHVLRDQINPVLAAVRQCPIPTVAQIEGPALGFGFGLALSCDIAYVAETALLGSPFRNIGLVMDSGGHYELRERLGRARAAELIFTGRLFSGLEAARIGLVNRAVAAPDLESVSNKLLASIISGPTQAFKASKKILDEGHTYEQTVELEAIAQAALMHTRDAAEGLQAFQEKRKPTFVGR
ncbi:enoyl-CoA hydratase [Paraburkholderia sp. CNPSo 3157]|nr:enoyl-CoA hydratase [Paraburkholderia franconis]